MSGHREIEISSAKRYKHPILMDDDQNTRLHYAASAGKEEDVIQYLEKEHRHVDVENYLGWTPLMMACRKGHTSTAKILLDYRADASRKNKFGMNVFLICIAGGNLELVQLILEHLLVGGISRQFLEMFFSPLSLAVIFNHFNILKFLIEKKFTLDKRTPDTGITPLMFAAAMESSKAYFELISKGANATLKNYLNHSCLDIFNIRKNMQFLESVKQEQQQQQTEKNEENVPKTQNILKIEVEATEENLVQTAIQNVAQKISPTFSFLTISPHGGSPQIIQIPNPNYLNFQPHVRKSSNVSPFFMPPPPNVTPITPISVGGGHQIFFPANFSPNQLNISEIFGQFNSSDLNARINNSPGIIMSPNLINFLSPCM